MSQISDDDVGSHRGARRKKRSRVRKPSVAVEPVPGRLALTANEAAWLLGVSVNTVWNLLAGDALESFTVGRRRLIARNSVESFIANGGTSGRAISKR